MRAGLEKVESGESLQRQQSYAYSVSLAGPASVASFESLARLECLRSLKNVASFESLDSLKTLRFANLWNLDSLESLRSLAVEPGSALFGAGNGEPWSAIWPYIVI